MSRSERSHGGRPSRHPHRNRYYQAYEDFPPSNTQGHPGRRPPTQQHVPNYSRHQGMGQEEDEWDYMPPLMTQQDQYDSDSSASESDPDLGPPPHHQEPPNRPPPGGPSSVASQPRAPPPRRPGRESHHQNEHSRRRIPEDYIYPPTQETQPPRYARRPESRPHRNPYDHHEYGDVAGDLPEQYCNETRESRRHPSKRRRLADPHRHHAHASQRAPDQQSNTHHMPSASSNAPSPSVPTASDTNVPTAASLPSVPAAYENHPPPPAENTFFSPKKKR